ncbi:uncharacterized protein LOC142639525 [Castanea sativa]|uniref:uncharacterized protein LOC142639525 n=1 Tax=Castanea sativa TaxID=21020 RepID=UPI003F650797
MVERTDIDVVAKVVCTAWAIWHNRNTTRHGGKRRHGKELVSWVTQYTEEFKAANVCMESTTPVVEVKGTWIPTPGNVFKVNVDAAICRSQKTIGVGVIIRDDMGWLEAAMSKKIYASLGVLEAEALVHELGLIFAKDIGVHNLILEGDSLIIHKALCETTDPPSSMATIIQGVQELSKEFRGIEFSHVRRQGNSPFHLLAKHALGVVDYMT